MLRPLAPMSALSGFVAILLVALGSVTAKDEAPTFHSIKLGVSLGSQFQKCPWNPPKEGDIPQYISSPYKDDKGRTIPCFHLWGWFTPAPYPQSVETVELFEGYTPLKDQNGQVLSRQPLPEIPVVYVTVLVAASTQLGDGTIERVLLRYLPLDAERVKDAVTKKFGTSLPPENKVNPKEFEESWGAKLISMEAWKTEWGKLFLTATSKDVFVTAETSKLISFEQENKKDEF